MAHSARFLKRLVSSFTLFCYLGASGVLAATSSPGVLGSLTELVLHEAREVLPTGFKMMQAAPGEMVLDLRIALKQRDVEGLEKRLIGVNTLLYGVEEFAGELREMKGLFEEGTLKVEGEWSQVRLEDGVEGYEKAGKKGGKIVLVMD